MRGSNYQSGYTIILREFCRFCLNLLGGNVFPRIIFPLTRQITRWKCISGKIFPSQDLSTFSSSNLAQGMRGTSLPRFDSVWEEDLSPR